jgi:DNA-binding NarL/FixJ family response regulator
MISVAVIEDNRMVRDGMAAVLSGTDDLEVVASGPGSDTTMLRGLKPHVILLDGGSGGRDTLRVAGRVKQEIPEAKVILTDLLPLRSDIVDFVNAGVSGFVLKDATVEELLSTIRSVAAGAHVLPPAMTSSLFSQIAKESITRGRPGAVTQVHMTTREREVIELIGEGLSNAEIAARLFLATHTVKSHVRNVMEKLGLHTRLQIAAHSHRASSE